VSKPTPIVLILVGIGLGLFGLHIFGIEPFQHKWMQNIVASAWIIRDAASTGRLKAECHDDKAMSVQISTGHCAILCTYDYNDVFSSRRPLDQTPPRKARQDQRPLPFVPRGRGDSRLPRHQRVAGRRGITKALTSLDRGKAISHARVSEWIASWETRKERPAPKRA
jgi:hypothetical protein